MALDKFKAWCDRNGLDWFAVLFAIGFFAALLLSR